jgi:hypothetical protein
MQSVGADGDFSTPYRRTGPAAATAGRETAVKAVSGMGLGELAAYYTPMLGRIKELKVKNAGVAEAEAVYDACKTEIEMFRQHSKSYGCAFFVLQRLCPPGIRAIRHAGDQRHL